jgi:nitronate monooxygenase
LPVGSNFAALLGVEHPIIQAPMAGGATTPELVAAVANAGALGMIGAAYLTPTQIADTIAATRRLTNRPFGVNLFAGGGEDTREVDPAPMLAFLTRYHDELGLPPPTLATSTPVPFADQLDVVLAAGVPIFSFTFGIPDSAAIAALKAHDTMILGTATTVDEARQLEAAGVDGIVAQGSEAGAHRGTFAALFEAAMVGTIALVPLVVDAVKVPVVASGGIMDGRGIVAAEALGAAGVQLGTAFLASRESGIPAVYKAALRAAQAEQTALTRAFSGRPARGIVNDVIRDLHGREDILLPFPLQNDATRPLRAAAAARGDTRFLSLWAGQGAALARDVSAADLVTQLVQEAREIRVRIAAGHPIRALPGNSPTTR